MKFRGSFLAILLTVFAVLLIWGLPDYGVTWDAANGELSLGDRYLYYWLSLDPAYLEMEQNLVPIYRRPDHPDFHSFAGHALDHADHVWGFGPMLTAASKLVFFTTLGWLEPIEAHHLIIGLLVMVQVLVLFCFTHARLGPEAAVACALCLVTYPRYWAHLHNNPKDVPEAVLFTLVILAFVRGIETCRPAMLLLAAALAGLALATKANAVFLPLVLAPWLAWTLWERRHRAGPVLEPRLWVALAVGVPLSLLFLFLGWPYLLGDFPTHIFDHLRFVLSRGLEGPPHWQRAPLVNLAITMPLPVMALALVGAAAASWETWRGGKRRGLWILVAAWFGIPVLRVCMPGARDFDVIRHWLEFLPALCLLAGLGASLTLGWLWRAVRGFPWSSRFRARGWRPWIGAAMVLLWLAPVIRWNVVNHPHQLVFYNGLVGGLGGAQARGIVGATDYWGSSYRAGLEWINEHAERDAVLMVGVAQKVVFLVRETWLRPDIRLAKIERFSTWVPRARGEGRTVYLMTITREDWYPEPLRNSRPGDQTVHEIRVDGGVILRILRIDSESMAPAEPAGG